ncbi:MAG: hypothetical protein QNJ70_00745 [Xenococcaceae cyanobacterium MO_207.B15]|nr:hypothetical protein [Xenococcaceae cyanobacterium MO_207.B15]MDJ0742573.1 hypothetical protein [Xenococcaceae cyanobacterium MO_167.B27]
MSTQTIPQTEQTKELLLTQLRKHQAPMSLQELEAKIATDKSLSHRSFKEAAWKLVEEGKAHFNHSWDLEISS